MSSIDKYARSLKVQSFIDSVNANCLPRIEKATVPIIGIQNNEIRHDRTGVLYQVGGSHFILTAGHNLGQIVSFNIPLYVSVNKKGILPYSLANAKFHWTEEDSRDIGVIYLPTDLANEIAQHKEFLFHNQVDQNNQPKSAPLLIFGFPMDWSGHVLDNRHVHSKALAFPTFEQSTPIQGDSTFDASVHILLSFTREAVNLVNGEVATLPKPNGISGCGIWCVGNPRGLTARTEQSLTLVGIQHGWFPDSGIAKATRIKWLLDLILSNYPATGSAMSVVYAKR